MELTRNWPPASSFAAAGLLFLVMVAAAGHNVLDLLNFNNFHEEIRALHHYDPARVNAKDYAGQLLSKSPRPVMYEFATRLALGVNMDLVLFHKLLSLSCILSLLTGGALVGWRLAGAAGAAAVPALIALQPIYQFQVNSGVPHSWGFPLLMWGLVLVLYNRPYALAGLTVLSGLLYAAVTPVLGLVVAWQLATARGGPKSRSLVSDGIVLVVTGLISIWLLWMMLRPIEGYGAAIPVGTMVDLYPENGPDGRNFFGVFKPFAYVIASNFGQYRMTESPQVVAFLMLSFAGLSGYGLFHLRSRPEVFRAFVGFILASIVICIAVVMFRPHVSYRYLLYPAFTVLPALFVCGAIGLCSKIKFPAVGFVAVMAVYTLSFNGFDTRRNGFSYQLDEPSVRLMEFVGGLPADSLLAAWPVGEQTDLIPYIAGRPLLVTAKAHYAIYVDYVLNMRSRMNDLTDAYLAAEKAPLIKLRCKWQVDYVVVDHKHFTDEEKAPTYFAPFKERIEGILAKTDRSRMILHNPPEDWIVFAVERFAVIDLAAIADGDGCASQG